MQRLVWQNSNGDEINLTSGNYGITNWEGFANTSLNIQSQQVPFQDGGVFLDALMEQRELSVTLAMYDGGNLETRYRMRRELMHILNPKLGEGYLIYTNDFISKRIKCVAQIPLFETHNSNDSGTPKASLAWTACDPYWEDLEETEVFISKLNKPVIINNGDVNVPIKAVLNSQGITNLSLYNQTNGKNVSIENNSHFQILINTENGNKSVLGGNVVIDLQTVTKRLTAKYQNENTIYFGTQNGMVIKTTDNFKTIDWVKSVSQYPIIQIYKHDTKYFICCSEILEFQTGDLSACEMYVTEDFETFTKYDNEGRKIFYSELFEKYVIASSGNVVTFRNDDLSLAETINFTGSPIMMDVCETNEAVYCIDSMGYAHRFTTPTNYETISNNIIKMQSKFITCCVGDGDYVLFGSKQQFCIYKNGVGASFISGGIRAEKDSYYGGVIIDGRILVKAGVIQTEADNLIHDPYIYYYDEYKYLYVGSLEFSRTRDLKVYEIIKNGQISLSLSESCLGILEEDIIYSYVGVIYKTKDFKIAEIVGSNGVRTRGVGVFNKDNNKCMILGVDSTGHYIKYYETDWELKRFTPDVYVYFSLPAIFSEYLQTVITRLYYQSERICVYDKINNNLISISQKASSSIVHWICEKGKYLYFGSNLSRITCVDLDHLTESEYKTEIITGISAEGINGGIYIADVNYFLVWDTSGNIYRSLNVSDWDSVNICNSQINKCFWCKEYNTLVVLTDDDGVYFVNIDTFEKKHILTVENEESFIDGVYYKGSLYLVSDFAVYKSNISFSDNIINKITDDSDLGLNLEVGNNLLDYSGNKDFSVIVKYRQKYIGV